VKERTRRTDGDVVRESDGVIVPEKPPNKGAGVPAEEVEERTPAKRNACEAVADRTQGRTPASCGIEGVRRRAAADPRCRFTALLHHITPELLRDSFFKLKQNAAPGLDGVSWQEYRDRLDERLPILHDQIHKGSYRATPVKRTYIAKANGGVRPLGVTTVEDKLVQQAVRTVLEAIYEADFLGFSYGFRPGRDPHMALDALSTGVLTRRVSWILDADLQSFFDTIPSEELLRLLAVRIGDRRVLRLIRKWLKTGYSEDGTVYRQHIGTPQGSVISPLLANVYLHYVLDEWVEYERRPSRYGDVIIVRYADDFVLGFEHRDAAERFSERLRLRLESFGLTLHPTKTRLIEFGRYARERRHRRGEGKPETFDFLGFTHVCGTNRIGRFTLLRLTMRKRLRATLRAIGDALQRRMHRPVRETGLWLAGVARGWHAYHGVPGNTRALKRFRDLVARAWYRALRRRSQKGKRMTWDRFTRILDSYIPHLRICHPFPEVRFANTRGRSRMR